MHSPRIAVVVPCHDDGNTLLETVESILSASEPVELVVVDDGSSNEHTLRVLEKLDRERLTVIYQANQGVSAARMAGIQCTEAPYVMGVDADDLIMPGTLTDFADMLSGRSDLDAVYGDVKEFGDSELLTITAPVNDAWRDLHINTLPLGALFRREALLSTGGWRMREEYEDWELWLSFDEAGLHAERKPGVSYLYRKHAGRRNAEARARHADVYAAMLQLHPRLVDARAKLRARSTASMACRLAFPFIERLPLSRWQKTVWEIRLHLLCERPLHALAANKWTVLRQKSKTSTPTPRQCPR